MFLAYAGSNAGAAFVDALTGAYGLKLLALGLVITLVVGGGLILTRRLSQTYGAALTGVISGTQTQPAVLAYSNDITGADPRVNLGYALVYPVAMIAKVILAPLIGGI
jgi:putative transport protein